MRTHVIARTLEDEALLAVPAHSSRKAGQPFFAEAIGGATLG